MRNRTSKDLTREYGNLALEKSSKLDATAEEYFARTKDLTARMKLIEEEMERRKAEGIDY